MAVFCWVVVIISFVVGAAAMYAGLELTTKLWRDGSEFILMVRAVSRGGLVRGCLLPAVIGACVMRALAVVVGLFLAAVVLGLFSDHSAGLASAVVARLF